MSPANGRRASIEALARAVAQSPDGIAVLAWEGEILYVNPAWMEMHGYSAEEIIGRRIQELYPGEGMAHLAAETVRRLAVQDSYAVEISHSKRDGTPFHAWLITTLLRDEEGSPNGFVLTARDVTEWKRLKEALENEKAQLKQLYERLREANALLHSQAIDLAMRNADLDAFAHSVAHDLKNPLTSIMGYAEMLLDDYDLLSDAERREFLGYIARRGVKMRQIVDELLLMSQLRNREVILAPLDMRTTVGEACSRLEEKRCERRAIIHLPESWPCVLGYAQWVEQVWVNCLSNAIKYGGTPPEIWLGWTECANRFAKFWVKDNGVGLSNEEQKQLFLPFTRLHADGQEGHGLGLSIVRRIVEKCRGTVGVESAPGVGSTFWFTLPRVEE